MVSMEHTHCGAMVSMKHTHWNQYKLVFPIGFIFCRVSEQEQFHFLILGVVREIVLRESVGT